MIRLPKNDLEKKDILKKIASGFEESKEYSEQEVDEIIKSFEVDDFILFRRELINFGYMERDPYRSVYWLKKKELSEEELNKIESNFKAIEKEFC